MGKPRIQTLVGKSRGWEPTLTQIAHRANDLWHADGCPATSDLGYWLRAREELKTEHRRLIALENSTNRAIVGVAGPASDARAHARRTVRSRS